jgi:exopolyphosphatase/guanosine-5'-triphosphate,3'-diphosphate pyrophosphatase
VATSASRDADNGREFMHEVAARLGVMPEIISGTREARLAFVGAIQGGDAEPSVVIDIGGGSTEFISGTLEPDRAISVDIGSVRLTDRMLPDRPASTDQLHAARELVADLIGEPFDAGGSRVIGVAGTFTSLAAVARGLVEYDRSFVHGSSMTLAEIDDLVDVMAGLTVAQTAAIPSMHPQRAPVILAGAVIAARALRAVGTDQVTVSEHDLLDALAEEARLKLG